MRVCVCRSHGGIIDVPFDALAPPAEFTSNGPAGLRIQGHVCHARNWLDLLVEILSMRMPPAGIGMSIHRTA